MALEAGFAIFKALRDIYTFVTTIKENLNETSRHLADANGDLDWIMMKISKLERSVINLDVDDEEKEHIILMLHSLNQKKSDLEPQLGSQQRRLDTLLGLINLLVKRVCGAQNLAFALNSNLTVGVALIRKAVDVVKEFVPEHLMIAIGDTLERINDIQEKFNDKPDDKSDPKTDPTAPAMVGSPSMADMQLSETDDQESSNHMTSAIASALGMENMEAPFVPTKMIVEFVGQDYADDIGRLCVHIQDEQGHVTMDALGAFFNSRVPSNPVLMLVHVLKALEHTFDEQVAKIGTDGLTNVLKDLEHTLKQEEDCEPRSPVMPNGNPGTALILGRISTLCKETMAPIINLALKMAFVVEAIGIPEMQDTPELEALALLDGFIAVAADIAAACKSGVPCIGALSRLDQLNLPAISFNPMAVLKNFNDALGALSMESLKIEARALQKQLQVVARTLDREYSNLSSSSVLNMPGRDIAEPQKKKVWAKHIFTIGTGPVGRIEVQLNASDGAYIGAKSIEK